MSLCHDRRRFLQTAAATGAAMGLGDLAFLARLRPVSAQEARLDPKMVRFRPEIEPLVRLLEETPRARLLEEVAARIQRGTTYREVLTALLLAGVRNVQPRPSVGFKFHAVLVVNSAHLASLSSPDADRWLPIFWALDYFRTPRPRTSARTTGRWPRWTKRPCRPRRRPAGHSCTRWNAGMKRQPTRPSLGWRASAGANEIYEMFFGLGARDFRAIGHKAIFVANSYRTLQCIGWQHAEPVLRSLAYALLQHEEGNPADRDAPADRPGRRNEMLAQQFPASWQGGRCDDAATADLLSTLRQGSDEDASRQVVELVKRGVAPQSLWDALFAGAGELLMRQPGIVALHAVTSTNALHHAFRVSSRDHNRRLLLLQNAAFLVLFREALGGRGQVGTARIDQLEPLATAEKGPGAIEEIFADASRDRAHAARKTLTYLRESTDAVPLIHAARRLVFLKGDDPHDYKFSSAVLEDYDHASPGWRDRFLAASLYLLPGSGEKDNQLVQRTRAALS